MQEDEKQIELFQIKFQAKKTRIDALFDPSSQANLVAEELIKSLSLKT